ncbi:MAG: DNA replication/repair protein RecF [Clostridiales bacterium]|jgi:DNA replication and repair protein RecF|nr:DNA replication/repair protein RecF [Clostridiales bacterium]
MHIQRVVLRNFRNIAAADIELATGANILYGENAQGKTNFLESIYFCATGRSHRTGRFRDLVMLSEKEAAIKIVTQGQTGAVDEIRMEIKPEGKFSAINGLPIRKLGELYGRLSVVVFSPEDLSLVKAGPAGRRRFLDMELCQLYPAYYHDLRMYHKVLQQRNSLLREAGGGAGLYETLDVWDEQLAEYGNKIMWARHNFIERLGRIAAENQRNITGGRENLEILYDRDVNESEFLAALKKKRPADILRGTTSSGIHRDDLEFRINGEIGRSFASQGQQRTAVLAVKMAEIEIVRQEKGYPPVLLLDDVLSELDEGRQNYLLNSIDGLQTIITSTGAENATGGYSRKEGARVFVVKNGAISPAAKEG